MAVDAELNPLISTQKSSDTSLQVALHPLVLLTISDYITRHTLRQQTGPIVGALLGQQNGREITIEHAFDCLLTEVEDEVRLNQAWFEDRLQQMKDVHKVPALDLVGWYTILPTAGPQPIHLPIHRQILHTYNESAILLGFHPTAVLDGSVGGKLPLSIYESNYEAEDNTAGASGGEDKEMKDVESHLALKFRELPYSVETGEAEMISVDFVARGGGNATAVDGTVKKAAAKPESPEASGKGKTRASKKSESADAEPSKVQDQHILSREDEELIASLTAKANAVKMLHSRINLIALYLQNLPPSYISNTVPEGVEANDNKYTPVNHSILRSIQALLSRLSLLIPADAAAFEQELMSEKNDVNLVKLLGTITESIHDIRETGRKFSIVDTQKSMKTKTDRAMGGGAGWGGSFGGGVMGVGDLLT
ncbi:related to cop9 (constitutive photomorphogenic), subunit 6 [Phialocephala subalpina]|uniref:COP9 signalosome complex subunit 6 n=1 Tax=Phialocephala subalpina TaxID=576137 RepID=A0A1L7XGA9_9HELO|nr:related to cop9 (constitutive photomorphogenic), subunit 6 [Phialocephala subalpina]